MYQRIVCFKFKAGASKEDIRAHMDHLAALQDDIPQIVAYRGGPVVEEQNDPKPDYDSLHYLIFESLAAIDAYFHHPAHQAFIAAHQHIWEDVLVINAAAE